MKKKRFKRVKAILAIMLAVVLCGGFYMISDTAFAEGGTVTVKLQSGEDSAIEGEEFTFRLYYIGGFDGPVFTQSGVFATSEADVSMPRPEDADDEAQWTEAWKTAAATLKAEIQANKFGKPDEIKDGTFTLTAGGEGTPVELDRDGLYLVIGEPVIMDDGLMWTPAPTFLGMLNGSSLNRGEINIKVDSRKVAYKHRVRKSWTRPEDDISRLIDEDARPTEIRVNISYGDEVVSYSPVTLNADNDWTFEWKSIEDESSIDGPTFKFIPLDKDGKEILDKDGKVVSIDIPNPDNKKKAWSVAEVITDDTSPDDINKLYYYETTSTDPQTTEDGYDYHEITNTLTTRTLTVKKTIKEHFDADTQNVTVIFKITGYRQTGENKYEAIYNNNVGVVFGPNDELEKETTLRGIPAAVVKLEAEEIYAGNYELDGKVIVTPQTDNGVLTGWTIEAENKHTGHGPKGGVVNHYKIDNKDKNPDQDFGN